MNSFHEQVRDRFIRYAKIDTQSLAGVETVPSTAKQFDLARLLQEELRGMGAQDVAVDEHCCVYAKIPSTLQGGGGKSVGFLAHMDTSPDASGTNVKPWVLENYQGGDIVLNEKEQIAMRQEDYPRLSLYHGHDLVLTDGTTLLGGDDKAAVAAIMTMADYLCAHPELPHGPIMIGFTPDEEVGLRGAQVLDLKRLGAEVAYTLDGDALGGFFYENFNGEEAQLTIHGLNVHPGTAKDIMVNAVEIGGEFMSLLPAFERPQNTCDREGYYHPFVFEGTVEKAFIRCLIRDHSKVRFQERHEYVCKTVEALNRRYGAGTVDLEFTGKYASMLEAIEKEPYLIEYGLKAIRECGVEPFTIAMRGGTDGAALSQAGLPSPNLTAGYENAHGRFEFVSVNAMAKNVEILLKLIDLIVKNA